MPCYLYILIVLFILCFCILYFTGAGDFEQAYLGARAIRLSEAFFIFFVFVFHLVIVFCICISERLTLEHVPVTLSEAFHSFSFFSCTSSSFQALVSFTSQNSQNSQNGQNSCKQGTKIHCCNWSCTYTCKIQN